MCSRCSKGWGHRHEDNEVPASPERTFWRGRQTPDTAQNISGGRARGWRIPFGKLAIKRSQENLSTEVTLEQGPERNEEAGDVATGDSCGAPQDHVAALCASHVVGNQEARAEDGTRPLSGDRERKRKRVVSTDSAIEGLTC